MKITQTNFKELLICNPTIHKDDRGYFYESFHADRILSLTGIVTQFVQYNQSQSTFGILRGLHF